MMMPHMKCEHPECNGKMSCVCPCEGCRDIVELQLQDFDERLAQLEAERDPPMPPPPPPKPEPN